MSSFFCKPIKKIKIGNRILQVQIIKTDNILKNVLKNTAVSFKFDPCEQTTSLIDKNSALSFSLGHPSISILEKYRKNCCPEYNEKLTLKWQCVSSAEVNLVWIFELFPFKILGAASCQFWHKTLHQGV